MKLIILACILAAALAEEYEPVHLFYHESVGIQEAAKIKAAEEAADFDGSRIIGGSVASLGSNPHLGGLVITLTTGSTSVCGSSLVTNTRLVTAAHCWWDGRNQARQFVVVLGSTTLFSGGTRIPTTSVQMHANFNTNNFNNDIAIISIPFVNYNNNIRNINLPSGTTLNQNFAGVWATATGFGRTGDNVPILNNQVLRQVNLQVITNAACQQTYGPSLVIPSVICTSGATGANVCHGDSGGSLGVVSHATGDRILIGVVVFVSANGCERRLPSGYARVTSFVNWIQARL